MLFVCRRVCYAHVACRYFSMHTIVGINTLSRDDHITAQTREYECTRHVFPQVLARGIIEGLRGKVVYPSAGSMVYNQNPAGLVKPLNLTHKQ